MMRWTLLLVALSLAGFGCGPESHTPDSGTTADSGAEEDAGPVAIPEVGSTATEMIGSAGGALVLEDFTIEIPPGALSAETEITVTVTDEAVPDTFTGFSPVFRFEPAGLTFDAPIAVRLPFIGNSATATVFWTAAAGDSFVPLPTEVEGRIALASSAHFSRAFVGTACSGDDCCDRANGDLDVLLMVDDSNSMSEEQAALAAQIPRLARVLATGDLDGDGVQDFPALRSVRIGTVSSDMGTGNHTVPTCDPSGFGRDGVLVTEGRTDLAGCSASYPGFAELSADDPSADVDAFVNDVSCVAQLGIGGCGFEQQLESVLKATTPSTSPLRFFDGTTGHADGANAGFLRPDSLLATIVVTDENDCSVSDPEIFNPSSATYGATDLNLRCFAHGDSALYPTSRYADGLRALRANPDDVIFALVAGVPTDLVTAGPTTDFDAILADPRMQEQIDPATGTRLTTSCDTTTGEAFPPTRLVEAARGFGSNGVVQSICQDDFTGVLDAILTRVAARVSGSCSAP